MNDCVNQQQWQPLTNLTQQIPQALLPWISCQTSLTEQLQQFTGQPVTVEVLSEQPAQLGDDAVLIGQQPSSHGQSRCIYLRSDDQRWIAAKTLVPAAVWQQQALQQLGTKPIGSLLFDEPKNSLRHIEVCRMLESPKEFSDWTQCTIWGRRSVFYLNHSQILIYEYFSERLYG